MWAAQGTRSPPSPRKVIGQTQPAPTFLTVCSPHFSTDVLYDQYGGQGVVKFSPAIRSQPPRKCEILSRDLLANQYRCPMRMAKLSLPVPSIFPSLPASLKEFFTSWGVGGRPSPTWPSPTALPDTISTGLGRLGGEEVGMQQCSQFKRNKSQ